MFELKIRKNAQENYYMIECFENGWKTYLRTLCIKYKIDLTEFAQYLIVNFNACIFNTGAEFEQKDDAERALEYIESILTMQTLMGEISSSYMMRINNSLYITHDGNVGIGTIVPTSIL
jgi:hypothetical protein